MIDQALDRQVRIAEATLRLPATGHRPYDPPAPGSEGEMLLFDASYAILHYPLD